MSEIKCPKCGTVFTIDEAGYAEILKQVRDEEFKKDLDDRIRLLQKEKEDAVSLAKANTRNELQDELAKKDALAAQLNAEKEAALAKLDDREKALSAEKEDAIKLMEQTIKNELQGSLTAKETELAELKAQIEKAEIEQSLAVTQAVTTVEKERDKLAADLAAKEDAAKLLEISLKDKYEGELKLKDEHIDRLQDLKAKLNVKMLGETLELHCENAFNQIRATAFQNAYFEKDNNIKTGSKGDYIYRESDETGTEIISIMFEMKNEHETTTTKRKNEDFLKELDKDRTEKNCEYAVLVSLLESDSDLYNNGIVDVSHKFKKM